MNTVKFDRVAFSPGEFAALFGKSQTWGYRQIYAGRVKAITEHGRILIPAAEVERVLKSAHIYAGLKPKSKDKNAQPFISEAKKAWRRFVEKRRSLAASSKAETTSCATKGNPTKSPNKGGDARRAALARLAGKRRPSPKSRSRG